MANTQSTLREHLEEFVKRAIHDYELEQSTRLLPMGFGITELPAGSTKTIEIAFEEKGQYRPLRLCIPSDFANQIRILSLSVNGKEQLLSGSLPGIMFTEFAVSMECRFDAIRHGEKFAITIENIGVEHIHFVGGITCMQLSNNL